VDGAEVVPPFDEDLNQVLWSIDYLRGGAGLPQHSIAESTFHEFAGLEKGVVT
jgi:hypothetical protein